MINKLAILIFASFIWTFSSCAQKPSDKLQQEADAQVELKIALSDSTFHNVVDHKTFLIKDQGTAIGVVEPILFSVYGKNNIIKQRPYKINLIENYWIVSGTLKSELGGVFLIIIDATNSRVIRLTHGK